MPHPVVLKLLLLLMIPSVLVAEPLKSCDLPIRQLTPGVHEVSLGMVRIKFEPGNQIAKMKLVGYEGLVEEWTSVSTAQGVARISGFVEREGDQYLYAQLIVRPHNGEFDWAFFMNEKLSISGGRGIAYFSAHGELRCSATTVQKWVGATSRIFGESFTESSSIKIPFGNSL